MHGPNQWPGPKRQWRELVLTYMGELTELGFRIMGGVALSLGLPEDFFKTRFCNPKPFTPFLVGQSL